MIKKILTLTLFLSSWTMADTFYMSDGRTYSGMDQTTIQNMLNSQGNPAVFITKSSFDQMIATMSATKPETIVPDPALEQALIDAKNDKLDAQLRMNALIKKLGL